MLYIIISIAVIITSVILVGWWFMLKDVPDIYMKAWELDNLDNLNTKRCIRYKELSKIYNDIINGNNDKDI